MSEQEELERRLKAAREGRASLAKAAAERDALAQMREEVEREERAFRDEQEISKAASEHGPIGRHIAVVETRLGAVILKRANHLVFKKFMDQGSTKTSDLERLIRTCLVFPDPSAFERIIEELPATLLRMAIAVQELAGVRSEEVTGKS